MVAMRVAVFGVPEIQQALREMNPSLNKTIMRNGMIASALEIQTQAANREIAKGGGGRNNARPPLRNRLTSRTGHLRRSIKVDRGPLPFAIEVGTDVKYGAVHEFGGSFSIGASTVREHTRTSAFGRRVKRFTVPQHRRRAHTANFPDSPPRAFMAPALDKTSRKFGEIFANEWQKEVERAAAKQRSKVPE